MTTRPPVPADKERAERSLGLAVRVAAAWALVGIPLAWGVWQVFQKSLDLFR